MVYVGIDVHRKHPGGDHEGGRRGDPEPQRGKRSGRAVAPAGDARAGNARRLRGCIRMGLAAELLEDWDLEPHSRAEASDAVMFPPL
jgi:hypothetical protein